MRITALVIATSIGKLSAMPISGSGENSQNLRRAPILGKAFFRSKERDFRTKRKSLFHFIISRIILFLRPGRRARPDWPMRSTIAETPRLRRNTGGCGSGPEAAADRSDIQNASNKGTVRLDDVGPICLPYTKTSTGLPAYQG